MKNIQRVISFLLAVVIVFGMMPVTAVSANETEAVVETTAAQELPQETTAFAEPVETEAAAEATGAPETDIAAETAETEPVQTAPETTAPLETESLETVPAVTETVEETSGEITAFVEAANAAASGTCGENLTWELSEDGILTISGNGKMPSYGSGNATPWCDCREAVLCIEICEGVTEISDYAFEGCVNVREIAIPDSVTAIGEGVLYNCTLLGSIFLSRNVERVEQGTFFGCSADLKVYCEPASKPAGWENMWYRYSQYDASSLTVFYGSTRRDYDYWTTLDTDVSSIEIPAGITFIPQKAFYDCDTLTSVTIGPDVTRIGEKAFYDCSNLRVVYIPDSVKTIVASYSSGPFYNCSDSLKLYCEPASEPEGWGDYWDRIASSTKIDVYYHVMPEDFSYWSTLNKNVSTLEIPVGIATIPAGMFENCDTLTRVVVGPDVRFIGAEAFQYCDKLETVFIPAGVQTTGGYLFYGCSSALRIYCEAESKPEGWDQYWNRNTNPSSGSYTGHWGYSKEAFEYWASLDRTIESLVISDSITRIPENVLDGFTSLKRLTISDSVTSIAPYAFRNCDSLTDVIIGSGVKILESCTFYDCDGLKTVFIPASVETITTNENDYGPFYGCDYGPVLYIEHERAPEGWRQYWNTISSAHYLMCHFGMTLEDYRFWSTVDKSASTIVIPDTVTRIPNFFFEGCTDLTSVTIGSGVTKIAPAAFADCSGLTDVRIGNGVVEIGTQAFLLCTGLTNFIIPDSVTSIGTEAFYGCTGLTSVTIGRGVAEIGDNAFSECTGLSDLTIPDSITNIGEGAFAGCTGLTEMLIPNSVISIGSYAFSGCTGLTAVSISSGVSTIGECAFYGCTGLSSLTIPASVKSVGKDAFLNCSDSLTIRYQGTRNEWFTAAYSSGKIICSDGTVYGCGPCGENGSDAVRWELDNTFVLRITGIGPMRGGQWGPVLWQDCKSYICEAEIGEGVTSVGSYAFQNCDNLTQVSLPETITAIGADAFYSCDSLTAINIPSGVTSIGSYAFAYCEKAENLYIPEGVTSLGNSAFAGCRALTSVTIPAGITALSNSLFSGCSNLTEAVLHENVTSIGQYAFNGCGFEEIILPKGLVSLGEYAFQSCDNLKCISIPRSVDLIPQRAFASCPDLTEIIFRHGANDSLLIGNEAFYTWEVSERVETTDEYGNTIVEYRQVPLQTTVKVPNASSILASVRNYDWTGSNREITWESHNCMNDHVISGEVITQPTCTRPGFAGKIWCEVCGQDLGENTEIPALGHTEVVDQPAVAPTCTQTGLTAQSHCSVCQENLSVQEVVPALGHSESIDPASAPTCTETGLTEGKHCDVCKAVLAAQEEIPALGHTEVADPSVDPACTENGLTEGSHCATCGEIFTAQEVIPATGHSFEDGICLVCGALDKADHTLAAGKSLTLKHTNPETGKPYTTKQIKWTMDSAYAPFATITAAGKLTAKKVVEKVRVEAIGTILGEEEAQVIVTADIYPAVTQVEILEGEEVVNGQTRYMDFDEESRTFTVQAYPLDTVQEVTWSISDARKQAYADYTIDGNTLTVTNPKEKAGTVTIKATVNAGVKKTVSFKLSFADFAQSVTITNTEETITAGDKLQLTAVVSPEEVTKAGVTWKLKNAADKAYASISKTGLLKTKTVYRDTPVTVVATTKDGLQRDEYTVTITPKDTGMLILTLEGENVTKSILNIDLNTESALSLTAENLADGSEAENITWKSSSNKIATVEDGMVLIQGKGNVTITAEEKAGKKVLRKASVTLKISALTSSVTIEEPDDGLEVASGKSITLKAICEDGAGSKVTWTIVKGAEYAKISSKGKLTANKDITSAKEVTVVATAADGSGAASEPVTVTIRPLAQGVQIYSEEGGRTLFSIRSSDNWWVRSNTTLEWAMNEVDTLQLSARVYPCYEEGGRRNAIQGVTWKSSSKKIATVDEDGLVTCIKPGTVTITATAQDGSGKKVSFKLKVINKIESLRMEDQEVKGGKSLKLAERIQINPTDATYRTFDWEITGGDGAAYASINAKGVLKAKKVKTPVEVEITAYARDGSGESVDFTVTIKP
nr:leucine-rich repeat protein [Oscillospiraceae bacterium]